MGHKIRLFGGLCVSVLAGLLLSACGNDEADTPRPPPPTYEVMQLNAAGEVLRTERVSTYTLNGNCVYFQTLARQDINQGFCGNVYAGPVEGFSRAGVASLQSPYTITMYDANMRPIRTWAVKNYWFNASSIGFTTVENPNVNQYVSGNVSAGPAAL